MKKLIYNGKSNVIGQALKLKRVKCGLTQEQLAARMQILKISLDQQMISKIEIRERIVTDYELACFALALNTDIPTLLADFYKNLDNTPVDDPLEQGPEE